MPISGPHSTPGAREHFLKFVWPRFPAADSGWLDVRTYLHGPVQSNAVVAGRLRKSKDSWQIESGGASLLFTFATSLQWLRTCQAPASEDLFCDGDLLAIQILKNPERNRFSSVQIEVAVAEAVLLLAPNELTTDESSAEQSTFTVRRSEQWATFLSEIRAYFKSHDFIEVQTPTLVPSPGTEPFLDPFSTEWFLGSRTRTFFLPTSPEFHLKQLLSRGWTRIFELKTCFRNGEIGEHHQPEFLMLEWYRAYSNLEAIANDVEGLLQVLAKGFARPVPPLRRTTISELFAEAFDGFHLLPSTNRKELATLALENDIKFDSSDSFDDVFFRIFLEKIEPTLGAEGPLLVSHYPPSQAALSRIGEHGFAERFEIYWRGLELANAFHELNDPFENETRFAEDAAKKSELRKRAVPRDENLIRALKMGMPPSGGIALGVDRLFMALFEIEEISQTRAFSAERP
jgi:lysyl-tRNA synthetase class 2